MRRSYSEISEWEYKRLLRRSRRRMRARRTAGIVLALALLGLAFGGCRLLG